MKGGGRCVGKTERSVGGCVGCVEERVVGRTGEEWGGQEEV